MNLSMTSPQLISYSMLQGKKVLALRLWTKQGCPLSPLLLNIVSDMIARAIRQEKETKCIQIRKEEGKIPVFAHGILLHRENPWFHQKKKKNLMKKFSKVAGYKINKWKSVVFLYTNELFEKKILSDPIYNSKKKQ